MSEAPKNNRDLSFFCLKWVLIVLIAVFVLGLLTKPLRKKWSNNYFERGNSYLEQKKYQSATLEYEKALLLYWGNSDAKKMTALADDSMSDVLKLENFYRDRKVEAQVKLMTTVKQLPLDEMSAVELSKTMIEKGEYQYAVITAKDGTEMDRTYRDSWIYLGLSNLDCVKFLELTENSRQKYLDEAETALEKATDIDPEYAPTKNYLDEIKKIR